MDWDYAFGHAHWNAVLFPAPVSHPQAIWGFLQNFLRNRFAVLHNLGYLYPHMSQKQAEKKLGSTWTFESDSGTSTEANCHFGMRTYESRRLS